ncbi:P-loop containing nucleoside triphosphate hydrolase protein [Armillaria mellea]|nr:P-loop containing nucleoside triphosphate hydrolase protein [Armillaria mellea]
MNVVASEEQIEALRRQFENEMQDIASSQDAEETQRHDGDTNPGPRPGLIEFQLWEAIGDMGVEAWAKQTEEALLQLLRWPNGRPGEFNPCINESLVDVWEDTEYANKVPPEGDAENTPTKLFWHQLVGITALVNMMWTVDERPDGVEGAILADEVGLGKSAQIMGMLAFIMAARRMQLAGKEPPPVIKDLPFFCGRKEVLNKPHLLIVPNTLLGQWRQELKKWFRPHTIDILVLPSTERGWEDWYKTKLDASRQDPCNIVIVGTHSNISLLGHKNLRVTKRGKMPAGELRPEKANNLGYDPLWKREFCSVTVDEAHNFRTCNVAFHSLQRITSVAAVRLLVTATPLYQSPGDLMNLGRLARIHRFLGSKSDAEEAQAKRDIARLRRKVIQDNPDALMDFNSRALHGDNSENPMESVYARTNEWVRHIHACFSGRVIRRSGESTVYTDPPETPPKKLLNDLPPYQLIEVGVTLAEAEQEEMDNQVNKWTKSAKRTGAVDVTDGGAFLLNYRLALAYPESLRHKDKEPSQPSHPSQRYAPFQSMQEWETFRGAKLQAAIDICKHMLSGDDRPPPTIDENNNLHLPELPPLLDGQVRTFKRKILIFHEFPMMEDMVKSVFKLYGIRVEAINGKMKLDQRQKIIHEFIYGDNIRVLLLSQIGVSGLNLMCATVVIIVTITWSGVEEGQMIGRAYRNGQEEVVFVFRIIAQNTIDVLMAQRAGAKAEQLETFFSKKESNNIINRKAYQFLYNCAAPGDHIATAEDEDEQDEEDDDEENEDAGNQSKRGKGKGKATAKTTRTKAKGNGKRTVAAVAEGSADETETPAPKKSKSKSRAKKQDVAAADGGEGAQTRKRKRVEATKETEDGEDGDGKGKGKGKGRAKGDKSQPKRTVKSKEMIESEDEDEDEDEDSPPVKKARRGDVVLVSDSERENTPGPSKTGPTPSPEKNGRGLVKGMRGKKGSGSIPKPRPVKSTPPEPTKATTSTTLNTDVDAPAEPDATDSSPAIPPTSSTELAPAEPPVDTKSPATAPTDTASTDSPQCDPPANAPATSTPAPEPLNANENPAPAPVARTQPATRVEPAQAAPMEERPDRAPAAGDDDRTPTSSRLIPDVETMGTDVTASISSSAQSGSDHVDELMSNISMTATQGSVYDRRANDGNMLDLGPSLDGLDDVDDPIEEIGFSSAVEPSSQIVDANQESEEDGEYDDDDGIPDARTTGNSSSSQRSATLPIEQPVRRELRNRGELNRNERDSTQTKSKNGVETSEAPSHGAKMESAKGARKSQSKLTKPPSQGAVEYTEAPNGFTKINTSTAKRGTNKGYFVKQ